MLKKLIIAFFCFYLTGCATTQFPGDEKEEGGGVFGKNTEYLTGIHYLLGKGTPKNYAEAKKWFEKSAEKDNPYAENELGYMYSSGKGVPKNYITAKYWFLRSANHGLASAQYNVGLIYWHGIGTKINKVKAKEWLEKSATNGFPPAKRALQKIN